MKFLKVLSLFYVKIVRNLVFFEILFFKTCAFDAKSGFMGVKSGGKKKRWDILPKLTC